ncbi:transferase [Streptomyces griseobrunneus]|uniref:transferase n=1 Tax=Streptomyces TaxID=1883 RepID=UPI0013EA3C4B|nr:transferase [Streptomyces sp. 196(2019)]NGO86555.1 transferase [Streptomyces sp. 196(2019)]
MTATATADATVRADCVADPAGTLTFELTTATAPASGAVLLLRRRGGEGTAVRLPLSSSTPGRLRAVLESATDLPEGWWDTYVEEPGSADPPAVLPGLRDLRTLVDRTPDAATATVRWRVPYPTLDGRLAVRSWVRAPHAEAGAIRVGPAGMSVEGVLYGAGAGEDAVVEARLQGDPARLHRVPLTATGEPGGFAFTLPYAPLATGPVAGEQLWWLWLIPAPGAKAVRISRILDDVWTRHKTFVYPGRPVAGGAMATPCYSVGNDLCVRVEPRPATA